VYLKTSPVTSPVTSQADLRRGLERMYSDAIGTALQGEAPMPTGCHRSGKRRLTRRGESDMSGSKRTLVALVIAVVAIATFGLPRHVSIWSAAFADSSLKSEQGTPSASTTAPDSSDAGSSDAGSSDAGSSDAGSSDAGSSDAGSSDAGSSDAGSSDAGSSDAGSGQVDELFYMCKWCETMTGGECNHIVPEGNIALFTSAGCSYPPCTDGEEGDKAAKAKAAKAKAAKAKADSPPLFKSPINKLACSACRAMCPKTTPFTPPKKPGQP
jgi:hypothetical protein